MDPKALAEIERILDDHRGPLLGVWTWPVTEGWLTIFAVQGPGLKYLAQVSVPIADRERIVEELRQRNARLAKRAFAGEHIWAIDNDGVSIWHHGSLTVAGRDGHLTLVDGRVIVRDEVSSVASFIDKWWIERGVRLDTPDGSRIVVAAEKRLIALADPGYGRDLLVFDAAWAIDMANALAAWLRVPHAEEISGGRGRTPVDLADPPPTLRLGWNGLREDA